MKIFTPILYLICFSPLVFGQSEVDTAYTGLNKLPIFGGHKFKFNYNSFALSNPSLENPKLGWRSSLNKSENIIFDFHPILTLHLFKNYNKSFNSDKLLGMGYYFTFRPHFRMYSKNSTPVQMPSYRFFLGIKHLYQINRKNFIGYQFESGHYSNGQPGCPFAVGFEDGSPECDSIFNLINDDTDLSTILNRTNGDYSTNLTRMIFEYRYIPKFDSYSTPQQVHTLNIGLTTYHNNFFGIVDVGGLADGMIDIYGNMRFLLGYTYLYRWESGYRFLVEEQIEIISGAHPWVNPFRSMTSFTFYTPRNVGLFVSYIYGHDDYNIRFVDAGHQFAVGLTWDLFPPIHMTGNNSL